MLPWVDVATGSLGQGLPDGVGVALAGKYLDRLPYRVWVLCGDSEMAEGSIWEALDKASYYQLSNLIAIVDVNRLGQRGPTELSGTSPTTRAAPRRSARGCWTINGHDLAEIDEAFDRRRGRRGGQPTVILARTIKGRGFSEVENKEGWHGKPVPARHGRPGHRRTRRRAQPAGPRPAACRRRPGRREPASAQRRPPTRPTAPRDSGAAAPTYSVGEKVATRKAYGDALVALGARPARGGGARR